MTLNRGTLTGSGSSCLVRWDAFTIPSEECLIDALYSQRQQTHEISLSVTAQEPSDWQSCWLNGGIDFLTAFEGREDDIRPCLPQNQTDSGDRRHNRRVAGRSSGSWTGTWHNVWRGL